MHILMFPQYRYPTGNAMLEAVFSQHLPDLGHRVSWIMSPQTNGLATDSPIPWNRSSVYLVPGTGHDGPVRPASVASRMLQRLRLAESIHRTNHVDIIHVRNELSSGLIGRYLRRRWKIPLVFQLSFPLSGKEEMASIALRETGTNRSEVLIRLKRRVQTDILRRADLVLAISEEMKTSLVQQGIPRERVLSFPMGFDTQVEPRRYDGTKVRVRFELENAPVVLYFGALDRIRRIEFLFGVIERVRRFVPSVKLLLLGAATDPSDESWLRSLVTAKGLGKTAVFCGAVERAEVPHFLAAASLSVSPIPPIPAYLVSSPTKLFESLGMGVPVVANDEIREHREVLGESQGGRCVPYEEEAFADAIVDLLAHPECSREAGQRGREYVLRNRSYSGLSELIEREYLALRNGAKGR